MAHKQFVGKLAYLSNMYPVRMCILIQDTQYTFSCLESAFQALKSTNPEVHRAMEPLNGYEAKAMGRRIALRPDWNNIKLVIMERLVEAKFNNEVLKAKLIAESPENIVEHNTWGDTFWGICGGKGQDNLGKILRKQRSILLGETL